MKVVILAGGLPSSLSDDKIPKPMLKVGERPLIWHIMKLFSMYGYNDFIVCTGYRSELIKDYFLNYYIYRSDITVDLDTNNVEIHRSLTEPWSVTIVDTGLNSSTAKRIKMIQTYINNEDFIVTYGDCISDIDIGALVKSYINQNVPLTVALAKPNGRNAIIPVNALGMLDDIYHSTYIENEAWSNTGTVMVSSSIFEYIDDDTYDRFEIETIRKVAAKSGVGTYKHKGFWVPVETVRDRIELEAKWDNRELPWRD
jgi:glucose-1-phosphate cytidylyltransferase